MNLDLEAIKARAYAAEKAPWRVVAEHSRDISDEGWSRITIVTDGSGEETEIAEITGDEVFHGSKLWDENAEFIAHAREDVEVLLLEVGRLLAVERRLNAKYAEAMLTLGLIEQSHTLTHVKNLIAEFRKAPDFPLSPSGAASQTPAPDGGETT